MLIGAGAAETAGAEILALGGSHPPAYHPRGAKAHGIGYAISNIGGSHMYGYARQEISALKEPRPLDA